MQPQLCSKCKKNLAVVFITRQENGQNINEGLCLKCAKNLGLPQVDEMMRRMGITDEDLDNISNEMMGAFGGAENLEGLADADNMDDEDDEGKTATFPFLSRLFCSCIGRVSLMVIYYICYSKPLRKHTFYLFPCYNIRVLNNAVSLVGHRIEFIAFFL